MRHSPKATPEASPSPQAVPRSSLSPRRGGPQLRRATGLHRAPQGLVSPNARYRYCGCRRATAVSETIGKDRRLKSFCRPRQTLRLVKLFVEPTTLRRGVGKALFLWATNEATSRGVGRLVIEADPDAAPFYRQLGAKDCGVAPSASIPGRILPKLVSSYDGLAFALWAFPRPLTVHHVLSRWTDAVAVRLIYPGDRRRARWTSR